MPEVEDRFRRPAGTYQQAAEDCIRTALEEKRINRDDEQIIREFVTEISATQHISPQRSYKL